MVGVRRTASRDARAPCAQRRSACKEHRPTHGDLRSGPHEGRNADTTAGECVLAKAICAGLAAGLAPDDDQRRSGPTAKEIVGRR